MIPRSSALLAPSNLMIARGQHGSVAHMYLLKELRLMPLSSYLEVLQERSSGMSVIQILVVDDFLPWQFLVRRMFEAETDLKIRTMATDGLEAVQKATELQPDVILIDISLPKVNGFEATRHIRFVVSRLQNSLCKRAPWLRFHRGGLPGGSGRLRFEMRCQLGSLCWDKGCSRRSAIYQPQPEGWAGHPRLGES